MTKKVLNKTSQAKPNDDTEDLKKPTEKALQILPKLVAVANKSPVRDLIP